MSFIRFQKYRELYFTALPLMTIYSTIIGINAGMIANIRKYDDFPFKNYSNSIENTNLIGYSNLIGYTSIGIITGITYPISYPLFGGYVLYKNHKGSQV